MFLNLLKKTITIIKFIIKVLVFVFSKKGLNFIKISFYKLKSSYENGGIEELSQKLNIVFRHRFKNYFLKNTLSDNEKYHLWIRLNEYSSLNGNKIDQIFNSTKFNYNPKISVVVSVVNIEVYFLEKCVQSVLDQNYKNWELIIILDLSISTEVSICLKKWEEMDKRIKVKTNKSTKHISVANNFGIKLAKGEFITFIEKDDEISPNALFECVDILNRNPLINYIYSDEDKIAPNGDRFEPIFKPDWCKYFMMSQMYTSNLSLFKTSIIKKIGGFRLEYEKSQYYDLVLRITENIPEETIYHIPKILYHFRQNSKLSNTKYHQNLIDRKAIIKTLNDCIRRRDLNATLLDRNSQQAFRIKYKILNNPKVNIIIPTKNKVSLLKKCINSIYEKTEYNNFEIIVVDNDSDETESLEYFKFLKDGNLAIVLKFSGEFNFSAINNYAVNNCTGEFILFLNNDTEVISNNWLESMLEYAQLSDVGCVGSKLLYPNMTIQHAGVIMGIGGYAGHGHRSFNSKAKGYMSSLEIVREYSALTGACLMISKEKFLSVGGFNEIDLKVAYNDIDLCLKCLEKGYKNIFTPYSVLIHYESISRGSENTIAKIERFNLEKTYMIKNWSKYINHDPYYNPNLTTNYENFSIKIN